VSRDSKDDTSEHKTKILAKIRVNFANTSESMHIPEFIFKVFNDDKMYNLPYIADT
jgi:hypothetical protein